MFKFLVQDLSNPVKPELKIDPPEAEWKSLRSVIFLIGLYIIESTGRMHAN
jgi:hypothetical protein